MIISGLLSRVEAADWCLVAIVVLQFGAVVGHVVKARWLEALVWTCYATATAALLLLSLKARP